eukprot:TRINITY_DN19474_c0_g1_i1.p1 TRINITY_DN19474_c0_g1~~TRINITY_DN19474_c0_g1_i1.p1  ORF type:complete len:566 (+),score=142.55 TRINITY_DN19474_c0_g1_i1:116-1699(+)
MERNHRFAVGRRQKVDRNGGDAAVRCGCIGALCSLLRRAPKPPKAGPTQGSTNVSARPPLRKRAASALRHIFSSPATPPQEKRHGLPPADSPTLALLERSPQGSPAHWAHPSTLEMDKNPRRESSAGSGSISCAPTDSAQSSRCCGALVELAEGERAARERIWRSEAAALADLICGALHRAACLAEARVPRDVALVPLESESAQADTKVAGFHTSDVAVQTEAVRTADAEVSAPGDAVVSFELDGEQVTYDERLPVGHGSYGKVYPCTIGGDSRVLKKGPRGPDTCIEVLQEICRWEHDGVVRTYGFASVGDTIVQVMEKGDRDLNVLLAEGVPSEMVARRIISNLANGLDYMHKKKFVHRDVKSSNVLLAGETAKLCDVESARPVGTVETSVFGSWNYVPPEVAMKVLDIPQRRHLIPAGTVFTAQPPRDTYALGVIACLLLTGQMPKSLRGTVFDAVPPHMAGKLAALPNPELAAHDVFYLMLATGALRPSLDPAAPMWGMLLRCIDRDASARPTAAEVAAAFSC